MIYDSAKSTNCKIHLPSDVILDSNENKLIDDLPTSSDFKILDISVSSHAVLEKLIGNSDIVLWNGPMGVFEMEKFSKGTYAIAESLADATENGSVTIIGGGDSAAAIQNSGLSERITHVSTGGGASLEFLEGKELPGVSAILKSK